MKTSVVVRANANIALIKYWGKRDEALLLPTKSSLSVTLDGLVTETRIAFYDGESDSVRLDGDVLSGEKAKKITQFLDLFRKQFSVSRRFMIFSSNSFPTAAGLASSASGFAALAYGLDKLCETGLDDRGLSILARQGSGSASRSLFGGFAVWHKGVLADGSDSFGEQLFGESHWSEFRLLVVLLTQEEKSVSSRDAMRCSQATSPSYGEWVKVSEQRIPAMQRAIGARDFETVGVLAEEDCLGMHQTMHDSIPSTNYWLPASVAVMDAVRTLRDEGFSCYFTMDAGANVKILCLDSVAELVREQIAEIEGVQGIISCGVGGAPKVSEEML